MQLVCFSSAVNNTLVNTMTHLCHCISRSCKGIHLRSHLNVSAAGHLSEVLLLFQGFVDLVVRHAEAAQSSLNGIMGLGEDDKLGHVWDADDLSVHLSGEVDRFLDLPTVYQPKSRQQKGNVRNQWGCVFFGCMRVSLNQKKYQFLYFCYLADTLVVKETQSLINVNGVVPVMSSHWAGVVPPAQTQVILECEHVSGWSANYSCVYWFVVSNQWYYKAVVKWGCPLRSHWGPGRSCSWEQE